MNLSYVLAELTRRPARTLTGVFSVAVGVALFVSLQAYATGYREAARAPLSEIGADVIAQRQGTVPEAFEGIVFPHSTAPIHRGEVDQIRQMPGVASVGEAVLFWDFEKDRFLVGLGLDPAESVGPGRLRAGLRAGRFLEPADHGVAVADATYAAEQQLAVGSTVSVAGQPFTLVGLVDTSRAGQVANANLYLTLADAQALADLGPDQVDQVYVRVARAGEADGVVAQLTRELGPLSAITEDSMLQVMGGIGQVSARFAAVAAAVGLAGGLVLTWLALSGLVAERRREIGIMKAVGWRAGDGGEGLPPGGAPAQLGGSTPRDSPRLGCRLAPRPDPTPADGDAAWRGSTGPERRRPGGANAYPTGPDRSHHARPGTRSRGGRRNAGRLDQRPKSGSPQARPGPTPAIGEAYLGSSCQDRGRVQIGRADGQAQCSRSWHSGVGPGGEKAVGGVRAGGEVADPKQVEGLLLAHRAATADDLVAHQGGRAGRTTKGAVSPSLRKSEATSPRDALELADPATPSTLRLTASFLAPASGQPILAKATVLVSR